MAITRDISEILTDFFSEHDKRHKRKVAKLVLMFEGREDELLLELCRKYNVSPNSIDGFEVNDDVAAKYEPIEIPDPEIPSDDNQGHESNDDSDHESNHADEEVSEDMEAPPKKGGKKKMIIALVVLLLAGGGAGAYFMGAMGGDHSSDPAQEQAAENEGDAESSESLISDSAGTEITADSLSVDSNTVNNDSVLVDSALVETEE